MPERQRRPDLDERFSLDADPEDVLRRMLSGTDELPDDGEQESLSAED
ncbi:MAG: hypothetical protein LC799_18385 [Actinobacteria bacterium]|nr:hypothetical protein [Actinomycetota bacterium]